MAPPTRVDPFSVMNFRLEIDGMTVSAFSEVSGLTSELVVVEYRSGAEMGPARKLPGMRKYSNLVFKRGITKDLDLWDWHKAAMDGNLQRKAGSIVLLDHGGSPVLRWNFRQGWPCKYEGPALKASSNEVAIETLEIAHEGLELEKA